MPTINLITNIDSSIEVVFNLSRSIDLHKISTDYTKEKAIAGTTTGLIGLNETVTWRAKHFGIYQKLTSKITVLEEPFLFVDEMVEGIFKSIYHEHRFKTTEKGTEMIDHFYYKSPLGILGKLADKLFLENYLRKLLIHRNQIIKEFAETEKWKEILEINHINNSL